MKKVVFFLLAALTFINVKAQTYEQTQSKMSDEISRLNTCLNQIKDKIYYFEVTLDEKLKDSVSLKKQSLNHWNELKKEKFFAKDNLANLKIQREATENTLKELTKLSLVNTETKIKTDMKSDLPEQMGRRELRRRLRGLEYASALDMVNGVPTTKMYPGLLANYKTGVGEIAVFTITKIGFPELPAIVESLKPREVLAVPLTSGDYYVAIDCGRFHQTIKVNVNSLVMKHFNGESVYWFACKLMSDF